MRGRFAAVDQLGVAATTTHSLLQAMLAVIVGSAIVAIGGGGIAPMRKRWEDVIAKQKASTIVGRVEETITTSAPIEALRERRDKVPSRHSDHE